MLGTIVNAAAVILGGTIGLMLKKGIPERMRSTIMKGLGLCTMYLGITGCVDGGKTMVIILSIAIGALIGEGIDLDARLSAFCQWIEDKFKKDGNEVSIAEGMISATLLFCVGAMSIVGSLQSGLTGNHDMIFTKSLMDGIAAIIFASSFGIGVLFSSILLFIYQGGIVLLSSLVAPYLSDVVITQMSCVGGVLLIGLSINMLEIGKIKVMNYVPAIFLPILLCRFF